MLKNKLLAGICLIGLSGCAGTGQPGPNTPPAVDHSFSGTRGYLTTSGICEHPQDSDPYRRNAPKEVRCLGGTWDSVALMVSGRDATGNELDKVRLLWRNWKPGAHLGNDKEAAAKFVAVLAERYISPRNRVNFAGDFLDGDSGNFRSGDFEVSMNSKDQGRYVLHRVELKNLAKRGTALAPTWVPPSPPKGDYIAPVEQPAPQPTWVNPNPAVEQPAAVPPKMPQLVIPPQPPEPTPVVPAPVEVKPVPPMVPPEHEIIPPQPEVMKAPEPVIETPPERQTWADEKGCVYTKHYDQVKVECPAPAVEVPAPVEVPQVAPAPVQPEPVVETPVAPQPVAPIQPPMERQPMSPAELIPNFPMDEEENYIFKEFDGEIGNDL